MTHQQIMDVSREAPDVTTKPKSYDLTSILVPCEQLTCQPASESVQGEDVLLHQLA